MYLPRDQLAQLYVHLQRNVHPLSAPVLILTALNVDALCATRIFTALLKRDYIPHNVQPLAGYADLRKAGVDLVTPLTRQSGGDGGVVVCIGVGGLIDLEEILGLDGSFHDANDVADMRNHGVEVWVIDAHRPWNLNNVFGTGSAHAQVAGHGGEVSKIHGVDQGRIMSNYRPGRGGIIVWDNGTVEQELEAERIAFMALLDMPEITEDDINREDDASDDEGSDGQRKRKMSDAEDSDEDEEATRPYQRRRSNSSTPIPLSSRHPTSGQVAHNSPPPSSQPESNDTMPSSPPRPTSGRQLRRQLWKLRRKHEATLEAYYNLGTAADEPVSSMVYSLASELGREDNDLLWLAIVGVCSLDLAPFSSPKSGRDAQGRKLVDRGEQIREVLRDEVRRLNPVPESEINRNRSAPDVMPSRARSPNDYSIRLSPEPKFMLVRHWSLYDSMMHSSYLSTRLHIWSDAGKQRLHKLLAKMGISLQEAGKSFVHMDLDIKQSLRSRLLKCAPHYNLDGLVPGEDGRRGLEGWGFVRSWGWKTTLSAVDVAVIVGAILEVGPDAHSLTEFSYAMHGTSAVTSYNARMSALPTPPQSETDSDNSKLDEGPDWTTRRFYAAYDALSPTSSSSQQGPSLLLKSIPTAQHLARAILQTGSALMAKQQIRHLRSFRLGVVKDGPDAPLFVHPGALVKLAAWIAEAVQVLDAEQGRRRQRSDEALVLACLDEVRGVYSVVGLSGAGARRKVRTKAELRQREEKKRQQEADRATKKLERARRREEKRRLQRERDEANGLLDSDDEDEDGSDVTESDASDSSDDSDESDEELLEARKQRGYGSNRFGQAFQEVIEETGARVRVDSFEHSVVDIKKEDLSSFLEALSSKAVVG